jgi:hypothetical protein
LRQWLLQRLTAAQARAKDVADYQFAFIYVIVRPVASDISHCASENWKVAEFGQGVAPHAPDEWPERSLPDLIEFAALSLMPH